MRALAMMVVLLAACSSAPPPATPAVPPTARSTVSRPPTPSAPPTPSRAPSLPAAPTALETSSATEAPTGPARPSASVSFGDGTHVVGEDIEPGTYRTAAYTESCYWTRLSGFDSGLADWISSSIGPGYHVVSIEPGDAGFESDRCGSWTNDLAPVTDPSAGIGEGTYIVGTDMPPGEWRATSGSDCYWARLSGFGGTDDEIVAEDLTAEGLAPVVTIRSTDVGFASNGCGLWRAVAP